jgi:DNA-directed RNA polymerase specialized sigma24 family protein
VPGPSRTLDPRVAADHLSRLYCLAWSLCGSQHLAEELTQETYARVLSRPRRTGGGNEFHYLDRRPVFGRRQRRRTGRDRALLREPGQVRDAQV